MSEPANGTKNVEKEVTEHSEKEQTTVDASEPKDELKAEEKPERRFTPTPPVPPE